MKSPIPVNRPTPEIEQFSSPPWFKRALCRGAAFKDTEQSDRFFFPISYTQYGTGELTKDVLVTKSYCASCPVRLDCLDWAIESGENHGMWGGMTPEERRKEKKNAKRRTTNRARSKAA